MERRNVVDFEEMYFPQKFEDLLRVTTTMMEKSLGTGVSLDRCNLFFTEIGILRVC